jgi:hypothetical protein
LVASVEGAIIEPVLLLINVVFVVADNVFVVGFVAMPFTKPEPDVVDVGVLVEELTPFSCVGVDDLDGNTLLLLVLLLLLFFKLKIIHMILLIIIIINNNKV